MEDFIGQEQCGYSEDCFADVVLDRRTSRYEWALFIRGLVLHYGGYRSLADAKADVDSFYEQIKDLDDDGVLNYFENDWRCNYKAASRKARK